MQEHSHSVSVPRTEKPNGERLTELFDRGVITQNEIRGLIGLPKVEGKHANLFFIRREYAVIDAFQKNQAAPAIEGSGTNNE